MHLSRFVRVSHQLLLGFVVCAAVAAPPVVQAASQKPKASQVKKAQAKKILAKKATRSLKARQVLKVRSAYRPSVAPRSVVRRSAVAVLAPSAALVSAGDQQGLRKVDGPLNLNSNAVLVIDQSTHEVLLGKNASAVLPIASLTKLMTGLLIDEARLPMEELLTIEDGDVDRLKNSGSRLTVGTRLTRGEALHLALMSSENRAAHALGRTYPGGMTAFVRRMNERAAELGMSDTRYVDPTGLSSDNQSSARDLATLVSVSFKRPMLRELSTSPSYQLASNRGLVQYRNSNRLIHDESWDIGLQKTGYIREAGRCLVMQVSVAGRQLIMVLLDAAGPAARIGDAQRLRRWAETALYSASSASPRVGDVGRV